MFLVAAFIFLMAVSCGNDPLSASITVKYEVSGSALSADIDYIDSNGELAIINGQDLPWEITFSANTGDTVYLSAKRNGSEGAVTVTIYRNGTILCQDTSADGTSATAEGTL